MAISRDSRFHRDEDTLFQRVDGQESILMSLDQGYFYRFNAPSSRIWELLQSAMTIDELSTALCAEFSVDPETCAADVWGVVKRLCEEGILREQPPA